MIRVRDVRKTFGGRPVVRGIEFQVAAGEMLGIVGPNGSGKSTLLKLMTGVEKPDAGRVELDGKPVERYSRRQLARFLAVLEQEALPPVGFTVREVVEMGRYPFQNWMGKEDRDADALLARVMRELAIDQLAERTLDGLSGGERQRVALAKAMAQEPKLLLMDEPTTYLDIGYQVQIMDMVRKWQRECGLTVVAVLHDLNLAVQYCGRLLVLKEGTPVAVGAPRDIVTEELIAAVYGIRPAVVRHPESGLPQILLNPEREENECVGSVDRADRTAR